MGGDVKYSGFLLKFQVTEMYLPLPSYISHAYYRLLLLQAHIQKKEGGQVSRVNGIYDEMMAMISI